MLTWFIAGQFAKIRHLIYRIISQHNREDDDRFALLDDSIWKIHVRNALKDGVTPPVRVHMQRRRYLTEDGGDIGLTEPGK